MEGGVPLIHLIGLHLLHCSFYLCFPKKPCLSWGLSPNSSRFPRELCSWIVPTCSPLAPHSYLEQWTIFLLLWAYVESPLEELSQIVYLLEAVNNLLFFLQWLNLLWASHWRTPFTQNLRLCEKLHLWLYDPRPNDIPDQRKHSFYIKDDLDWSPITLTIDEITCIFNYFLWTCLQLSLQLSSMSE